MYGSIYGFNYGDIIGGAHGGIPPPRMFPSQCGSTPTRRNSTSGSGTPERPASRILWTSQNWNTGFPNTNFVGLRQLSRDGKFLAEQVPNFMWRVIDLYQNNRL